MLKRTHGPLIVTLLVSLRILPLGAQRPDSGTVAVTVRESMGMVQGFLIRSERRSVSRHASGQARLVLPAGLRTLDVTRIGFAPKRVTVTVIADSTVSVTLNVEMQTMTTMEEVTVTSTRIERLAGKSSLRVEVLDEIQDGPTRGCGIHSATAKTRQRTCCVRLAASIRTARSTDPDCRRPLDDRRLGSARRFHGERCCAIPMATRALTRGSSFARHSRYALSRARSAAAAANSSAMRSSCDP